MKLPRSPVLWGTGLFVQLRGRKNKVVPPEEASRIMAEPIGVLVADDEPRQRRGLAALIRSLRPGYRVYEAKNGKEALKLVRESAPEIVFTDIQMPLASGLEFLEAVGRLQQAQPKVVLVSVYSEFSYAQQALRLGAKDYLLKPVRPEQLSDVLEKLEKQLHREQARSAGGRRTHPRDGRSPPEGLPA